MRARPPLVVAAGLAALAAVGGGVALADGGCGDAPCKSDAAMVTLVEPQPIEVGGTARVKLMAKNNGPDGVANVAVRASFPAGLEIVGTTTSNGAGCAVAGGEVGCDLGPFAKEQGVDVIVTVRGAAAGSYAVPARVVAGPQDDNPGNDLHTATVTVNAATAAPGGSGSGGSGGGSGSGGSGSGGSGSGGSGSGRKKPSGPPGYLRVDDPQRPLKTGGVTVRVRAYRAGKLTVRGTVRAGRGRVRLTPVTIQRVRKGSSHRVFLGTTKTALGRIRSGLRGGARLRTTITATLAGGGMKTEIHLKR